MPELGGSWPPGTGKGERPMTPGGQQCGQAQKLIPGRGSQSQKRGYKNKTHKQNIDETHQGETKEVERF